MLEGFLGANCDIPAGAFTSPHFLFNEVMVTLGCTLSNLDEFTKLKLLNVKAINLGNSQANMTVLSFSCLPRYRRIFTLWGRSATFEHSLTPRNGVTRLMKANFSINASKPWRKFARQ